MLDGRDPAGGHDGVGDVRHQRHHPEYLYQESRSLLYISPCIVVSVSVMLKSVVRNHVIVLLTLTALVTHWREEHKSGTKFDLRKLLHCMLIKLFAILGLLRSRSPRTPRSGVMM